MHPYMTAREVCHLLGINTATLYSYVSRGLIRSESTDSSKRTRRYLAEDVAKLMAKRQARQDPESTARNTLRWGMPIMESALTYITPDGLYYRGKDATQLAQTHTFEEVAALLWDMPKLTRWFRPYNTLGLGTGSRVIPQMISALNYQSSNTPYDLLMLDCASAIASQTVQTPLAENIAHRWTLIRYTNSHIEADLVNAALILCADHELNASTFAVRIAAAAGADLPRALIAGLAALSGTKHGGAAQESIALLQEAVKAKNARQIILDRLNRGERIPGFGHPLYPNGDVRAALLLRMIRERYTNSPEVDAANELIAVMREVAELHPNIDLSLALLEQAAHLQVEMGLGLFALGRMAGWIAHAQEQYAMNVLLRPRAKYVGVMPDETP